MRERIGAAMAFVLRWVPNSPGALVGLYGIDAVGAIVQNVVLARVLSLQNYGLLAGILSAGMFAFVISDLGTGLSVCRLMAAPDVDDPGRKFRALWTARVLLTLTATVGLATFVTLWFPKAASIVILILASEIFRSIAHFLSLAARGAGGIRSVVVIGIVDRIGTLVGSILALAFGQGLAGVAAAYLLARFVSVCVAFSWVIRARLPLRFVRVSGTFVKECFALTPLASLLLSDKIVFYSMPLLISLLGSTADAGLFQAAFKVALLPISVCSALVGAYFPDFVREASGKGAPRSAVAVYGLVMLLAAPLVSLSLVAPAALLRVLFGTAFMVAGPCLRVLGLFVILNIAYQLSVHLLPAYHKEAILLRSTSLSSMGCLLVAAMAIPRWGAIGACVAITCYASMALVPNSCALRGLLQVTPPQRRVMLESMLTYVASIGLVALLDALVKRPMAFLGTSLFSGGLISLFVLYRSRSLLGETLFFRRRAPESAVLEQVAI